MTDNQAHTFLQAFHAQHPGVTTHIAARGQSPRGSSYDILASEVPTDHRPLTVLDLACGDGYLLELLQRRHQPNLQLIGADMSAGELAVARQRLGPNILLLNEPAQQLSVAAGSVDIVLCHLALMLMTPLDEILTELRRILKPGGLFSAIVNPAHQTPTPVIHAFGSLLYEFIRTSGRVPPDLGDHRTHDRPGLALLFAPANGFTDLTLDEVATQLDGTPVEVADFFANSYNVFALGDLREAFIAQLEVRLGEFVNEAGIVPFTTSAVQIQCHSVK